MWHLHNAMMLYENFPFKSENFHTMTVQKKQTQTCPNKVFTLLFFLSYYKYSNTDKHNTRRSPKIEFNHHKIHNLQFWTTQRIEVTHYQEREAKQPCLSFKTVVTSKLYQASPDLAFSENLEWQWFLITLMLNFLPRKSHQNSTYTICNHYFSAITVHLWGVSCLSFHNPSMGYRRGCVRKLLRFSYPYA